MSCPSIHGTVENEGSSLVKGVWPGETPPVTIHSMQGSNSLVSHINLTVLMRLCSQALHKEVYELTVPTAVTDTPTPR